MNKWNQDKKSEFDFTCNQSLKAHAVGERSAQSRALGGVFWQHVVNEFEGSEDEERLREWFRQEAR